MCPNADNGGEYSLLKTYIKEGQGDGGWGELNKDSQRTNGKRTCGATDGGSAALETRLTSHLQCQTERISSEKYVLSQSGPPFTLLLEGWRSR